MSEWIDGLSALIANRPRILHWDILARIVVQVGLFSASAFFSGSETALFSLSKFDLQRLSRAGDPVAATLRELLEQPRRLIVSILCGNELVNIAAAANMTAILIELVGVEAAAWTATFLMIPLILLLGEVTPKTLAVSNPVWAATRIVARPINTWVRIVTPLAYVVRTVADRTTTLIIGPERAEQNILHVEELRTLIQEGVEAGEISPTERALVNGYIVAGSTEVREIMTPRDQVAFLDASRPAAEIRAQFLALRHPRVPLFVDHPDHVVGILHVEDVIDWSPDEDPDVESRLHAPLAVPSTKQVDEMLDFFDESDARAALVVSEFGGVDGIVTLADVTRFLFSGVFDTEPTGPERVVKVEGGFEVDGSTPLSELLRVTGLDIREPFMTTIAGTALRYFGRVPAVGDQVELEGFRLEVLEMDDLRIARVRLERSAAPQTERTQ